MRILAPLVLSLALGAFPASHLSGQSRDDDDDAVPPDGDIARRAVERGEILPLSDLLPRLSEAFPGRLIDIELDLDDEGRFEEYEFEILTPEGLLIEVDMDAVTGEITEVELEDFDDDSDDDD